MRHRAVFAHPSVGESHGADSLSASFRRLRGKDSNLDYLIQRWLGKPDQPRQRETNPHRYALAGLQRSAPSRLFSVGHVAPVLPPNARASVFAANLPRVGPSPKQCLWG
jgi:hypothetical protein